MKQHISLSGRNVILEFYQLGQFVKVSAVDEKTLTEVSIQGPASASQDILRHNALRRLEYVLRKNGIIQ